MEGENSLYLGWMDVDYVIKKDESPKITEASTATDVALYEQWEHPIVSVQCS